MEGRRSRTVPGHGRQSDGIGVAGEGVAAWPPPSGSIRPSEQAALRAAEGHDVRRPARDRAKCLD